MAFRAPFSRLPLLRPAISSAIPRRPFHTTRAAAVRVGDPLPDLDVLVENSPGNKVNLAEEFKGGDGIIIGVPAAFSGACSTTHVPGYMNHPKLKNVGRVFVVSVNDPFV